MLSRQCPTCGLGWASEQHPAGNQPRGMEIYSSSLSLSGGSPWQSPGTCHAGFGRFPTPRKEAWKDSVLQTSSEHERRLGRPLPKTPNAIACIPAQLLGGFTTEDIVEEWGGGASDRELTEAPVYLYPPHALKQQRLVMTFSTP